MQVGHFPATAANSLVEGYCNDFVSLAAALAQTLEQVSMRGLDIRGSHDQLARVEVGMRGLAEAIHDLLARGDMPTAEPFASPLAGDGHDDDSDDDFLADPPKPAPPTAEPERFVSDRTQPLFINPTGPLDSVQSSKPRQPAGARRRPDGDATSAEAPNYPPRPQQKRADAPGKPTPGKPTAGKPIADKPKAPAQPPREAAPDDDDGALRGTSQSMPVLSVVQFLGRTRKNGTLRIQLGGETLKFEFENGCVQACTSTKPIRGERLGDLLIETTGCSPQDLSALLKGQTTTAKQLGELVVQAGLASNGQVLEALELQVRRRFTRACEAKNASYEFRDGRPSATDGRVRIAPMELTFQPGRRPNA